MDQIAAIRNAEKSISRKEDRTEECELSTDHNRMIEEMAPSCMAISVLGRLMLVTHEKDVSLNEKPPEGGFKHIKYPHSLRASLVQVSNDGHTAFQASHINMDEIRRLTMKIPDLLNEVVIAAAQGTDKDVEMTTRDALMKLEKRAKRCAVLARDSETKYHKVMYEIKELLEAAASTKGHHEQVLKENLQKMKILDEQRLSEEEEQEASKQKREEVKKLVAEAREMHKSAMEDIPSNMVVLATGITQEMIQTVTTVLSFRKAVPAAFKLGSDTIKGLTGKKNETVTGAGSQGPQQGEDQSSTTVQLIPSATAFAVRESVVLIRTILGNFSQNEANKVTFKEPSGGMIWFETKFTNLCTQLAKTKSSDQITSSISEIARSAASKCTELNSIVKAASIHGDSEKLGRIEADFKERLQSVLMLDTSLNQLAQMNPTPSRSPVASKAKNEDSDPSALSVMRDNAHFKVKKAQETLKMYEEQNLEAEKQARQSRAKLQETMAEIKQLDLTKTDMESIQKTLEKGFVALTKVSEIWSELVIFFSNVASMVESTFYEDIMDFNKKATNMLEYESTFSRGLMYEYAKTATQSTIAIHSLSSMYVEVSGKFLLPPLAKLPRLIYPTKGESIMALADELDRECDRAVHEIGMMAEEKREIYSERVRRRLEKIEAAKKSLPPITMEQEERNKRAIKSGMDIDPDDF